MSSKFQSRLNVSSIIIQGSRFKKEKLCFLHAWYKMRKTKMMHKSWAYIYKVFDMKLLIGHFFYHTKNVLLYKTSYIEVSKHIRKLLFKIFQFNNIRKYVPLNQPNIFSSNQSLIKQDVTIRLTCSIFAFLILVIKVNHWTSILSLLTWEKREKRRDIWKKLELKSYQNANTTNIC